MTKLSIFLILMLAFPAGCGSMAVSPLARAYVRSADCYTRDHTHKGTLRCPQ
jgi:hypothetical protein